MNWNIKKKNNQIEVSVELRPRTKASQTLVGVSSEDARTHLEENGLNPGKCLNPTALAGNLDTMRLTTTWFFEDATAPKSSKRKTQSANTPKTTTSKTNKAQNTKNKEA
tara:strand:+ start:215 stop:541 length:327 start_codon:yes stop_codon:yes gene_type:complete